MATDNLPLMFGLIGVVVVVATLLSGLIERSNIPQVAVFLGLGAAVGPYGFGLLDVGLDSSMLRMVATLSLALVLFTDALSLDLKEVRKHAGLASLILGPGTLIAAAVMAVAAFLILDLPWASAAILAAPLASTDPVMLRGLLKRQDLPSAARQALRLESGLNDIVLLPIVLIAMAFVMPQAGHEVQMGKLILEMLVIGPGAGAAIAWVGIGVMVSIRKRVGVRRDYESLYSLGLALAAYAAAEALHGSGFLAAFAAGLTIAAIDVELCDCFREYGETTAEILLLFTFVLLGASLIWTGLGQLTWPIIGFVGVALAARPAGLFIALYRSKTPPRAKRIIIWFGPRGLSTLLLILVPVFAGVPGSEPLFHVATVLVLVSVALHGGTIMFSGNRANHRAQANITAPEANPPPVHLLPERLTPAEIRGLEAGGEEVWLADARRQDPYLQSPLRIKDAVRLHPQFARRDADRLGIPRTAAIGIFCSCPDDKTARRIAEELQSAGWRRAFAVWGGWEALLQSGWETVPAEMEEEVVG